PPSLRSSPSRRSSDLGLRGPIPRTSTRVASVRTHSAFNRGVVAPLHRSSPCRHCASALVLSLFASPIGTIEGSGHSSRPAQLHSDRKSTRLNSTHQII